MKTPNIFDSLEIWEIYLRQCSESEIDELVRAIGDISGIVRKLIIEDLTK